MDNDNLQGMLPSRAVLARLSIFGVDEATRKSANAILRALPPMSTDERRRYYDEIWKLASLPSEEDMLKSPAGRATLGLLKNSKPMGGEIQKAESEVNAPYPEPKPTEPEAPPEPAVEPVNEHLSKLLWPPASQQPKVAAPPDDEPPRYSIRPRFVAGRPSDPDKSQRPISDDYDSNKPLY